MKKNEKSYKGEIFVIISSVLFGLMPLLVKVIATHGGNACMTALGRFFIGSLILFTAISARRNISLQITLRQFREITLLSVFYALTPVLLFSSYSYMDSGLATTLHFTFPVLVIVFSVLLFRVCPDCRQIFCTLLCTVVISQLSGGEAAGVTGVLLAIASGVTYALYIVFLGKSSLQSVSALATVFWLTLLSSMEIALFAAATGNLIFPSDATAWGVTALLALLSTALALVLFQMGLFRCGPIRASLLSTFEPLTSVVVGSLVFYETLTVQNLIGIFCVLGSGALLVLPASLFSSVKQFLFAAHGR